MIKKGDQVRINPEWQDEGDNSYLWVALEDEDGGRVRIAPIGTGLAYPPNQVVRTLMLEHVGDRPGGKVCQTCRIGEDINCPGTLC